jgi:hypothetical protein
MKLRPAAALALVGCYLMMLSACTADDSIAAPGTADVETWYLMTAPLVPVTSGMSMEDPTAPIRFWIREGTFPTKKECDAHRTNSRPPPDTPGLRCLSAEDMARAKAVHVVGWLLMMAPYDDVTASLAQWTANPEAGGHRLPPSPVKRPATNIEIVCSGGCLGPGTVIDQRSSDWWSKKLW